MRVNRCKRIVLAAVTLLCLLSLGLPLFYTRWSSRQLATRGALRPEQPGMLSEAGQEHPLVYALYRRRFAAQAAVELPGDSQRIQRELQDKTEALAEAGALPELVARRARWILEQTAQETTCTSENGFASATCLVPQEETPGFCSVTACWQEETGLVVSYIVTADTVPNDLGSCLTSYQDYLGVDGLPDWQVGSRQEGEAWAWSPAGQLSLFCRREGGRFLLGAASQAEPSADVFSS